MGANSPEQPQNRAAQSRQPRQVARHGWVNAPCDDDCVRSAAPDAGVPEVSRDELVRAQRARRVTLVDVLSPESFAGMHIPGAINLPVATLAGQATRVLPDRAAPIVTYCGGPT